MAYKSKNKIRNVVIYLRRSSGDNSDEDILANHTIILNRLVRERGYNLVETYSEIISGAKYSERVALHSMLDAIDSGHPKIDGVIVMAQDRLSRDLNHFLKITQRLIKANCLIITPGQIIDLSNSDEKMGIDLLAVFAERERTKIVDRVVTGKIERTRRGEYCLGKIPLGYRKDPTTNKLVIEETEAELVRKIFKLYLQGHGIGTIAEVLSKEGYRTAKGDIFNRGSLRGILTRETYMGMIKCNIRGQDITVYDTHPKIISSEDFLQVKEYMTARGTNTINTNDVPVKFTRSSNKTLSIFSNLLYCLKCGYKIHLFNLNGNVRTKECSRCRELYRSGVQDGYNSGSSIANLAGEISEYIKGIVVYAIRYYDFTRLGANIQSLNHDLDKHTTRLNQINKELNTIENLHIRGDINYDKYKSYVTPLQEEIHHLNLQISTINESIEGFMELKDFNKANDLINNLKWVLSQDFVQLTESNVREDIDRANRILSLILKKIIYFNNKNKKIELQVDTFIDLPKEEWLQKQLGNNIVANTPLEVAIDIVSANDPHYHQLNKETNLTDVTTFTEEEALHMRKKFTEGLSLKDT